MLNWLVQPLDINNLVVVFLAMTAGAALQGSVGYGMALVASPILILVNPKLIPGPYLLGALILNLLVALRERQGIDFHGIKWAIIGRIPGTILAGYLLAIISERTMILTFGILLLLGVAISIAGIRFPPKPRNLLFAGALSALMGTIATIGGPPMALVYQDAEGVEIRPTLSSYFILGGLLSIVTLALVGKLGQTDVRLSLFLMPGAIIGYLISSRVISRLNPQLTRVGILAVAAISSLIVLIQELI
jgi:uncharacterized membrane protein YfcA